MGPRKVFFARNIVLFTRRRMQCGGPFSYNTHYAKKNLSTQRSPSGESARISRENENRRRPAGFEKPAPKRPLAPDSEIRTFDPGRAPSWIRGFAEPSGCAAAANLPR